MGWVGGRPPLYKVVQCAKGRDVAWAGGRQCGHRGGGGVGVDEMHCRGHLQDVVTGPWPGRSRGQE